MSIESWGSGSDDQQESDLDKIFGDGAKEAAQKAGPLRPRDFSGKSPLEVIDREAPWGNEPDADRIERANKDAEDLNNIDSLRHRRIG